MQPKKVAKKRAPKLVKPAMKIPKKITVKIRSEGSELTNNERNISVKRKIELANEVALAQLLEQSASRKSHKQAALPAPEANTQEIVKKPFKKFSTVITDADSLDDFETTPQPKKKKPGPKSKTTSKITKTQDLDPLVLVKNSQWEVKGKTAKPKTKAKNKLQKNTKQKLVTDNLSNVLNEAEKGATQTCMNIAATPPAKRKGRPKGSIKRKPKNTVAANIKTNAEEIKAAAAMLEHALGIASPHSRPNSVISNRSNLSWTRDISTESSLSSGITATANDFVRFNNKLPLIQVEKCTPKVNNITSAGLGPNMPKVNNIISLGLGPSMPNVNDVVSPHRRPLSALSKDENSSSDSESSSSSDSELSGTINTMPELNLSTSSTSCLPISDTNKENIRRSLDNLNNLLKNFYLEISYIVPYDHDDSRTYSDIYESVDRELNAIPPFLKGEDRNVHNTINKCDAESDFKAMFQENNCSNKESGEYRRITGITEQSESVKQEIQDSHCPSYEGNCSEISNPVTENQYGIHNDSETIFAKPCLVEHVSAANTRNSTNLPEIQMISNLNRVEASPTDAFKTLTSDNNDYDRSDDDEDALSLYAESICGIESSKLDSASVSNASVHEVYVPKSTTSMPEKYIYRPTKIQLLESSLTEEPVEDGEIISNTDDKELDTKPSEISRACVSSSGYRDINKTALASVNRAEAHISSQPRRLFSSYSRMSPPKSTLYRGICFFNIASQCRNIKCRFPHDIIHPDTFKHRLSLLSEDNLISEYLLMNVYESLKRNFCILFVEECKRRAATRILFEMAIDLGLGVIKIDEDIRVKVLETALLHLNTISVDACDDLLKFKHKDTMLCDALLACMANSQNFAQFKRAFVKLANLICELKRPVNIEVARSILERVCILPGEDILARGMLSLMKNTGASIFESSLAKLFENQLSKIDSDVHEVYLLAKESALEGRLPQPEKMHPATPLSVPRREDDRHTSPDSTHMDKLPENNTPIFARFVNDKVNRNFFKLPANQILKKFMIPRLSQMSTSRQNSRGPHRKLVANRGRGAYNSQMVYRNGTNE